MLLIKSLKIKIKSKGLTVCNNPVKQNDFVICFKKKKKWDALSLLPGISDQPGWVINGCMGFEEPSEAHDIRSWDPSLIYLTSRFLLFSLCSETVCLGL